jgi:hypothetical protein
MAKAKTALASEMREYAALAQADDPAVICAVIQQWADRIDPPPAPRSSGCTCEMFSDTSAFFIAADCPVHGRPMGVAHG